MTDYNFTLFDRLAAIRDTVATSLKVAKDLGREYLGFEKEPHYYNQAVLRLNGIDQRGQTSLTTDYDKVG